MGHWLWNMK